MEDTSQPAVQMPEGGTMVEGTPPRRRPIGLYIIVGLQFVNVILFAVDSVSVWSGFQEILLPGIRSAAMIIAINTVIILLFLISIAGLLLLNRFAWLLTMLLTGAGLLLGIVVYLRGATPYLHLLAGVCIVFYLNQRNVQQLFRPRQASEAPA